jgi:hypothetical protein
MSEQKILNEARNTLYNIKNEEEKNITPYASYASFANQVIGLINKKKINSKEGILEYTQLSYPRPGLNRQWRKFDKVLQKNLKGNFNQEELLLFFGYLKRLLTIAGKNQTDENKNREGHDRHPGKNNRSYPPWNKRR